MKKLQFLLNHLQAELEGETGDSSENSPTEPQQANGTPLAPGRLVEVKEKLKPIVANLLDHQRVLESEDQLRKAELARVQEISRFQAAELHAIVESLPDAIFIATKEGMALCNTSALRMLGASTLEDLRDYPKKSDLFQFRWPDGTLLAEAEFPLVRALRGETTVEEFQATVLNTGESRHVRAAAAPILENGQVMGAIAIHTDISRANREREELRRAYETMDELYQELKAQTAELNAVFEAIPDGIFIGDTMGIRRCNAHGLELLGVTDLEALQANLPTLLGKLKVRWADTGLPLRPEETPFARAMQGESIALELIHTNVRTGEELIHRSSGAPMVLDGKVVGAVAVNTDITASVMARLEVEALNANLDRLVLERTRELTQAKESLELALGEVGALKERLEAENSYLQVEEDRRYNFGEVISNSDSMKEVFRSIEAVAPQDTTVLLLGETGTGKNTFARAIHARSARKERNLVVVNCTSLPGNLIESELFGREKGAFTGAHAQQIGRFELADKGTILLDEIGDLPWELQAKLLHVLQEKEFSRLGSPRMLKVDVRIIAATNRDLREDVAMGRFREDLYYRLSIFPVVIPPLRQRREDIPLLVESAMQKFSRDMGKKIEHISAATMKKLVNHAWPGNVRELQNVIERAVINTTGSTLQVMDTFEALPLDSGSAETELLSLAEVERAHILKILRQTQGRIDGKNGAALILGMNPSTLRGRMRKEGIERLEWA
jgi:PAS domain S-box-containing protein